MSNMDDFASELTNEVLGDMAESFFGARKRMDERIALFVELAHDLGRMQVRVHALGRKLFRLFPDNGGPLMLLEALGLDGSIDLAGTCRTGATMEPGPAEPERRPRSFTLKGRYTKLVLQRYAAFQEAADKFMNGRLIPHPDSPKRRILSPHYQQLRQYAERLNQAIEKSNSEMPVSCIIRYAHDFSDPGLADKERITGAHCPLPVQSGETELDKQFAYHSIDFDSYGLVELPDFPPLADVRERLRGLCAKLYATEKAFIVETMDAL